MSTFESLSNLCMQQLITCMMWLQQQKKYNFQSRHADQLVIQVTNAVLLPLETSKNIFTSLFNIEIISLF